MQNINKKTQVYLLKFLFFYPTQPTNNQILDMTGPEPGRDISVMLRL